jgi:O-antigen/teichoic acid export membrane protein
MLNLSLSTLADKYCPSVCRPVLNRVQQSPIGKRIVSGTFWSVFGNGFGRLFTFIAMVCVARILGKEAFGEFGLVRSTATAFVTFSSFGMGITATKYIAELLHTDKERTGRIVGLSYIFTIISSFFIAILFYVLSPWLCEIWLKAPHLTNAMQLGSILLFLMTFMGTQISVMTGFQDFRGIAYAVGIAGFVSLPIYVFGAYYGGTNGAIIAVIINIVLNVFVNLFNIQKNTLVYNIKYDYIRAFSEMRICIGSNVPIFLNMAAYQCSLLFCCFLLAKQINGKQELGQFYIIVTLLASLTFLPTIITSVLLPNFSKIKSVDKPLYFIKVVNKSVILILCLSFLLVFPLMLFPNITVAIFGKEFIGSNEILLFGCADLPLALLCGVLNNALYSQGRYWISLCCGIAFCGIWIWSAYYLITNSWGSSGIYASQLLAHLFCVISLYYCFVIHSKNKKIQQ